MCQPRLVPEGVSPLTLIRETRGNARSNVGRQDQDRELNPNGMNPEQQARQNIDRLLEQAGWALQDAGAINLYESAGVAVREFSLKPGHGSADYLLYVNRRAAGIIEAKPEGHTLVGVEIQSEKYSTGLPDILPAYRRPLPFLYQSTGCETRFTNLFDPDPRSRSLFAFHKPQTLAGWLGVSESARESDDLDRPMAAEPPDAFLSRNLRRKLDAMPPLDASALWPVQERAIESLERSLASGRRRALVQMATGSGKTFMACNQVYRLIKHAGARRVLFLVDRANLGRQALREFQGFTVPGDHRKFTELYNVQLLQSARVDPVSRVCIATIQRVYSMLKGEELDPQVEELSGFDLPPTGTEPPPVGYNPDVPIETFDFIITDECHRSIYNLWRQVLDYFDAFIVGLTATPSKQTFGFFRQNLVMEYSHRQAVADNINVDFDIYRIRTQITEGGSTVEAGYYVDRRNRLTRKVRWEQLEEDLTYAPNQLDKDVVAEDQIRTVIGAFKERLFTDIFPHRRDVPKTIIFAKDDSHADDIVRVVRRGVRQGQRLLPEDHLQDDRSQTRRPALLLPQQLQPPRRRHRRHDRHRHRHQARRDRLLHAQRAQPRLLRANEGTRRPHHLPHRFQRRNSRRQKQRPLRNRRRRRRHRERAFRLLLAGA